MKTNKQLRKSLRKKILLLNTNRLENILCRSLDDICRLNDSLRDFTEADIVGVIDKNKMIRVIKTRENFCEETALPNEVFWKKIMDNEL